MARKVSWEPRGLMCGTCNRRNKVIKITRGMKEAQVKLEPMIYCGTERARTKHTVARMPNTKPQAQKR